MKWEVRTVRNMQLTNYEYAEATGNMIAVPNLIHSTISPILPSLGADIEFGITCLPEGELKSSNTIFQLNIFAGVTAIHNSKHVQAYLESYTEDSLRIGTFIPRWDSTSKQRNGMYRIPNFLHKQSLYFSLANKSTNRFYLATIASHSISLYS